MRTCHLWHATRGLDGVSRKETCYCEDSCYVSGQGRVVKNCWGTLSGQGYGVLSDCQGSEWRPCYAGLRFPLTVPHWLPRRTPTAAGGTPVDPLAFIPTPAAVAPGWTQNCLPLILSGVCADYLCISLEKRGTCVSSHKRRKWKGLGFPQSRSPRIFCPSSFYTYWMGVTYLMLIIGAFMSDPLLPYVTHSFAH